MIARRTDEPQPPARQTWPTVTASRVTPPAINAKVGLAAVIIAVAVGLLVYLLASRNQPTTAAPKPTATRTATLIQSVRSEKTGGAQ